MADKVVFVVSRYFQGGVRAVYRTLADGKAAAESLHGTPRKGSQLEWVQLGEKWDLREVVGHRHDSVYSVEPFVIDLTPKP